MRGARTHPQTHDAPVRSKQRSLSSLARFAGRRQQAFIARRHAGGRPYLAGHGHGVSRSKHDSPQASKQPLQPLAQVAPDDGCPGHATDAGFAPWFGVVDATGWCWRDRVCTGMETGGSDSDPGFRRRHRRHVATRSCGVRPVMLVKSLRLIAV